VFDRATVSAIAGGSSDPGLGGRFMNLVRRDFIRPDRSADGADRFRFSHALLRDAVYAQMSHRLRSELHERYADVLQSVDGDPEMVGHHFERAYRERSVMAAADAQTTALGTSAGKALATAGRRALARKEWQHAADVLGRAQSLLATAPIDLVAVQVDLIRAYGELSLWEQAEQAYEAAVAGARQLSDASAELRAEMAWAEASARTGNAASQERLSLVAQRAVEHFSKHDADADLARALWLRAYLPASTSIVDSIEMLKEAARAAERGSDELTQIEIWDELGGALIYGPTPYVEIHDFVQREIAWARERGIAFAEADGLLGETYVMAASGDLDSARRHAAAVRELFAQLPGFVAQLGETDVLSGSIEVDAGNPIAAEQFFRRATETTEKAQHALWWRTAAISLAGVMTDLGRYGEAEDLLDEIDRRGMSWGTRPRSRYLSARARLSAAAGDVQEAIGLAREAIELVTRIGAYQVEAQARELLGDLLAQAGDSPGAQAEWERSRELFAAKGYRPGERRVAGKLGINPSTGAGPRPLLPPVRG
jgi:tetratricopeptide (TPR) repeat protein